jgi:hypothetical protein
MIEFTTDAWHMVLLIFREMGWQPGRDLAAYTYPLTFITNHDGEAMQRAVQSLFAILEKEPALSAWSRWILVCSIG